MIRFISSSVYMFTPTALDQTLPEALQLRLNQAPDDWGSTAGRELSLDQHGWAFSKGVDGGREEFVALFTKCDTS